MFIRESLRGLSVTLLVLLTAVIFGATPAAAAPAGPLRAQVSGGVDDVTVSVPGASFSTENGYLVIRAGGVSEQFPLTFIAPDERTYPIDATIKGHTATLVPSRDAARSTATAPNLLATYPVADKSGYRNKDERDAAALDRLVREVNAGVTVTTVIGAAIGAILGGAVGCIAGLAVGPLGCFFAGIPLGAAAGGGAGVILAGGVAGAAVIQYFNTVNKPFVDIPETTGPTTTAPSAVASRN